MSEVCRQARCQHLVWRLCWRESRGTAADEGFIPAYILHYSEGKWLKKRRSLPSLSYLTPRNADTNFIPLDHVFEAPGTEDSHCNRTDHQCKRRKTTSCSILVSDCICLVCKKQEETVKNISLYGLDSRL